MMTTFYWAGSKAFEPHKNPLRACCPGECEYEVHGFFVSAYVSRVHLNFPMSF